MPPANGQCATSKTGAALPAGAEEANDLANVKVGPVSGVLRVRTRILPGPTFTWNEVWSSSTTPTVWCRGGATAPTAFFGISFVSNTLGCFSIGLFQSADFSPTDLFQAVLFLDFVLCPCSQNRSK